MSKHQWKFTRDIKDEEWKKFEADAKKFLDKSKGLEGYKSFDSHKSSAKELMIYAMAGIEGSDNLLFDRSESTGSCSIKAGAYNQEITGVLTIAAKHFEEGLSIETDDSLKEWQPGIDAVADRLSWDKGELINYMTEKLGFKK